MSVHLLFLCALLLLLFLLYSHPSKRYSCCAVCAPSAYTIEMLGPKCGKTYTFVVIHAGWCTFRHETGLVFSAHVLKHIAGWCYFWHCKIENKNERCRAYAMSVDAYVSRIIVVIFISITAFFFTSFLQQGDVLLLLHLFVFNNLFLFYMEIKMV